MLEQKKVIDQGQEGKETGMKGTGRRKGQKKLKKLKGRIMRISIMEGKTVMNVYLKKKIKRKTKLLDLSCSCKNRRIKYIS